MKALLKRWSQRIKCVFGHHDWLLVSGSQKQTGFVVPRVIFPVHELQEDEVCDCCRLHRTRFGLLPNTLHQLHAPEDFKTNKFGWPVDRDGNKLPGYLETKGTYQWHSPPKKHGTYKGDSKLVRRWA